jgi:hypothetical protein
LSAPLFGCFGFLGVFAFLSISNLHDRQRPDRHRAADLKRNACLKPLESSLFGVPSRLDRLLPVRT